MKKASITALLVLSAPWAYSDYTVEFGPKLTSIDSKAKSSETDTWYNPFLDEELSQGWQDTTKRETDYRSVGATAYFGRVNDSGVPLPEAGFLSKLGNFSAELGTVDSKSRIRDHYFNSDAQSETESYSGKVDGAFLDMDLQIVTPGVPIILGVGLGSEAYESSSTEYFFTEDVDILVLNYRLHAGFYYSDQGSILYTYENSETEYEYADGIDANYDTKSHKVAVRQLFQLPASQHLALNADYTKSKQQINDWSGDSKSKHWQAGLDYYPISKLQLGISTSKSQWEGDETEKSMSYRLKYFFTPRIFAALTLAGFESSEKEPEYNYRASARQDLFELAMGFRF